MKIKTIVSFTLVILFFALFISHTPATAQITHQMTLNADQQQETISRHIYGHFAEHLGRGVYDGLWTVMNPAIRPSAKMWLRR